MPRGRGRGRGKGRGGKGRGDNMGDGSGGWKHEPWMPLTPHNDLFEAYYKGQEIIPAEEWDAFYKSLQTPLPTTFRVTASGYFANVLRERIQQAGYHKEESFEMDGELVEPPRAIPWYPNKLAYHTSIPRKVLKRNPELESFHKFLISQGDQGNITRQEAVSMLPPLFLDVQPHHTVLDMCAAPGSKTTQIIEFLHSGGGLAQTLPTGLVIANDVEKERCYMLVHHTKRLASPAIVVTNNPAQTYPRLPIRLDRILADVPCSGDGTLRKNVDLWRRWNPAMGSGLHSLQVRIAYRAAQMLAVGGRMVYSTCSLNPSEDEAVVMELIRQTGGVMELVDVSTVLPELKYSPGISKWRMMDKDSKWYSSYNEVPQSSRGRLRQSLFPPTEEEAMKANLHYTLRILPHAQNTGGFYVAVFVKKDKLPPIIRTNSNNNNAYSRSTHDDADAPKEEEKGNTENANVENRKARSFATSANAIPVAVAATTPAPAATVAETTPAPAVATAVVADEDVPLPETAEDVAAAKIAAAEVEEDKPKRAVKDRTWIEEPFIPLSNEMRDTMKSLQDFYGLADLPLHQIFTRSNKNQKLYFVTESIASLINQIQEGPKTGLTIVNSGVKMFHRHESSKFGYRVCQDSIQWVLPLITKRKVLINHQDLVKMLTVGTMYPNNFSKPAEEGLNALEQGCVVFVVDANSNEPSAGMGFVAWFSKRTVQLLIKKREITGLKHLFCPKPEPAPEAAPETTTTTTTSTTETTSDGSAESNKRASEDQGDQVAKKAHTEGEPATTN